MLILRPALGEVVTLRRRSIIAAPPGGTTTSLLRFRYLAEGGVWFDDETAPAQDGPGRQHRGLILALAGRGIRPGQRTIPGYCGDHANAAGWPAVIGAGAAPSASCCPGVVQRTGWCQARERATERRRDNDKRDLLPGLPHMTAWARRNQRHGGALAGLATASRRDSAPQATVAGARLIYSHLHLGVPRCGSGSRRPALPIHRRPGCPGLNDRRTHSTLAPPFRTIRLVA
jgi:hypothetical protein